jgi:hypothetical protein
MAESGRRLPDDVCEYYIYPPLPMTFDDEVIERQLEQYMDLYLAHISEWLVDYIWQNRPFNLRVVTGLGKFQKLPKGSTTTHCANDNNAFKLYCIFIHSFIQLYCIFNVVCQAM